MEFDEKTIWSKIRDGAVWTDVEVGEYNEVTWYGEYNGQDVTMTINPNGVVEIVLWDDFERAETFVGNMSNINWKKI